MQVVIFAGGTGSRLSEYTEQIPKPLVPIGDSPIIHHIMKIYAKQGFTDFVICLGYKGYLIKEYFYNYYAHNTDMKINLKTNEIIYYNDPSEDWTVSLIDTGVESLTGSRLLKIKDYIKGDFLCTYGDGVGDVNINSLIEFHNEHNRVATLTAVQVANRFGVLKLNENQVEVFQEKPINESSWINAGFFVFSEKIFDYLEQEQDNFDLAFTLSNLAHNNELSAYRHNGFWKAMDTLQDKRVLDSLWNENKAPWRYND